MEHRFAKSNDRLPALERRPPAATASGGPAGVRLTGGIRLATGLAVVAALVAGVSAALSADPDPPRNQDRPERVVSLNLCTDQLLVLLADRDQIAGISFLAADETLSYVSDRIDGIPLVSGRAEEVLDLEPDLILAGPHGAAQSLRIFATRDIPILRIGLTEDFDSIRATTRRIGDTLGQAGRAQALIDEMDAVLAQAEHLSRRVDDDDRPAALVVQAQGFTAGSGTLKDTVIRAAGLRNTAAESGLAGYGYIGLERILLSAPDLLIGPVGQRQVSENGDPRHFPSLADDWLHHRALAGLIEDGRARQLTLPAGTTACGGPFTVEAVSFLAREAGLRDLAFPSSPPNGNGRVD